MKKRRSDKLGIRKLVLADGPHGVRVYTKNPTEYGFNNEDLAPSTLFPGASAMASTFNEKLIKKVGETIGKECNMYNVDVLLAPGVNLKRSPLAGRNFEYYSEDPFLTARMAINFIGGVQSQNVGTCIKHFALNEQENQRRFINSIIDERTFHEMYLKPFKMAIDEVNPMMIMSSYNKVNNDYASESSMLLKDVLRKKWNYDGVVLSDWGAVQDKVKSLKNGMNIEMPGPSEFTSEVYDALKRNELSEEEIDESLKPLLTMYDKLQDNPLKGKQYNLKDHHKIAQEVGEEAIVLLENDGILPLKPNQKIAVIGDFASNPRVNGGGSAHVLSYILENPLAELKKEFEVEFAQGYVEENTSDDLLKEVSEVCETNEIILYFAGTTKKLEQEGKEREHMNLPKGHIEVLNEIKKYGKKVIVILNNGGPLDLTVLETGVNAVVEGWFLGNANANALLNIITGKVNPSGRLSETIPFCIEHTPFYPGFPIKSDEIYYQNDITRLGYRYYDTHKYPVRYPFGYGLSYTTFEYSNLVLSNTTITDNDTLELSVDVTNTGNSKGKEVVQVYLHDVESYLPKPYKELVAFEKIELEPNETKTVQLTISSTSFAAYSIDYKEFRVEPGEFILMVGKSVNNIVLQENITYKTELPFRNNLSLEHPLKNYFIYQKDKVKFLEEKYRKFPWYEIEEPAIRVLKRLKRDFNISDEDFLEIIENLKN